MKQNDTRRIRTSPELEYLQSVWQAVQNEEFPEGPYGSTLFPDDRPGKTTPWQPRQRAVSAYQDENPAFSDGAIVPPGAEPRGEEL